MGSVTDFLSKFGGQGEDSAPPASTVLSAGAPNALGAFMDTFSTLTESYWFYNHTEELRYDKEGHVYFRVDPDLGNLIELHGVTTVLKKTIDRSVYLVPWGAKMVVEKLLRLIPLASAKDEFGSIMLAPITLEEFTKLCMAAKTAPKDKLDDAGDLGKKAHECLEKSIQHAIDHTNGIVLALRDLPENEQSKSCAEAGFAWMQAHHVRWIKTEQKIYSREYQYAGTMDGKALVDSCDDPSCCSEYFKDSLSIVDWKSSNALRIEYILQVAGAYRHAEQEEHGEVFQNCFVLRLGKNEEEAGKFEPWRIPAKDFPLALAAFLACLNMLKLVEEITELMSTQKKGVRELKKKMKAEAKVIAKATAKLQKEAEKAQKKLDRAAERERIKQDAKKARELAKHGGVQTAEVSTSALEVLSVCEAIPSITEGSPENSPAKLSTIYEDFPVERKPYVIPEEG